MENLERAVQEIDALEAIYSCEGVSSVLVHSQGNLLAARSALDAAAHVDSEWAPPELDIELKDLLIDAGAAGSHNGCVTARSSMRCRLPPGYPDQAAVVTVSVAGLKRGSPALAHLNATLAERASALAAAGSEAVMELAHILLEHGGDALRAVQSGHGCLGGASAPQPPPRESPAARSAPVLGRRWIWVHHIADDGRRKAIVAEARERGLGGFLKSGYPGIVVVEGASAACTEFVRWIKGNKSRPGGFGRQWGHHVRGEINIKSMPEPGDTGAGDTGACGSTGASERRGEYARAGAGVDPGAAWLDSSRQLPATFSELKEMSALGHECKACGLEGEFLEYVVTGGAAKQR